MSRRCLRIAHRGASAHAPEHTRPAFEQAVSHRADMIELDVQLSSDGELIVIHDHTLERTTNGQGLVREKSAKDLKGLDAGGWFGSAFCGEAILTLRDVIDLLPDATHLNVEVKSPEVDWLATAHAISELLRATNRIDTTIVSSFMTGALAAMRRIAPPTRLGLLWHQLDIESAFETARELDAVAFHPFYPLLTQSVVDRAHDAGLAVITWTVNDTEVMKQLEAMGVDGIISDYPDRLLATLAA